MCYRPSIPIKRSLSKESQSFPPFLLFFINWSEALVHSEVVSRFKRDSSFSDRKIARGADGTAVSRDTFLAKESFN